MTTFDLLTKFRDEFLFVKKILNSCTTEEQVNNAHQWFSKVTDRWWSIVDLHKKKNNHNIATSLAVVFDYSDFVDEIWVEWEKLVNDKKQTIKNN